MDDIYEAVLIKRDDGWGYEIRRGGAAVIVQPYHPDKPGSVSMTKAEATAQADATVERLTSA